jgi:hypothetical protein
MKQRVARSTRSANFSAQFMVTHGTIAARRVDGVTIATFRKDR